MTKTPEAVAEFLRGSRIAVAGVSRTGASAANPVFRKLRAGGYDVFPVNPSAPEVEGVRCYPNLASIPGRLDGVVVATHPDTSATVVQQAVELGVRRVWLHRSFGKGSVSDAAVQLCRRSGISCIVGGCPLMYCRPIDIGHRCMRAWLNWRGHLPT